MEELNNAINTDNQQQPTTIVSTTTTVSHATPIDTHIVGDFEPDSKWEITTLERASYDCNDIYLDSSLDSEQQQAENGKTEEKEKVREQEDAQVGQINPDEQLPTIQSGEPAPVQQQQPEESEETVTFNEAAPVEKSSKDDDCKIELHSMVNAAPQATDETPNSLYVPTSENGTNTQDKQTDQLASKTEAPQADPSQSFFNTQPQQRHESSSTSTVEQPTDSNPTSNLDEASLVASQSSVDAQMAKVIENVVELTGCGQFSHSDGMLDKERAVESIHREIIGDRNPMEMIADVAINQQILEESIGQTLGEKLEVRCENVTKPASQEVLGHKPDLSTTQIVTSHDDDATGTKLPHKEKPADSDQSESKSSTVVADFFKTQFLNDTDDGKDKTAAAVEVQPSTIVEEPVIEEAVVEEAVVEMETIEEPTSQIETKTTEVDVQNVATEETVVETRPARSVASEEPDNITGKTNFQPVVVTPIVEEAVSADELVSKEEAEVVAKPVGGRRKQKLASTVVADVSKDQVEVMEIEEAPEQTPARRSSRKIKVKEFSPEEPPKAESRKGRSKSLTKGQIGKPDVEPELVEEKNVNEPLEVHQMKEEETAHEAASKSYDAPLSTEKNQIHERDEPEMEAKEDAQTVAHVAEELTNESEEASRPMRSVRARALKRPIEEKQATDEHEEIPRVEPLRKQLKRSRGVSSEHNKSYETVKSAPQIKLPYKSRSTISSSDPASRPDRHQQIFDHDVTGKYKCDKCRYSTDRLNNIVFHHKRPTGDGGGIRCSGAHQQVEDQVAEAYSASYLKHQQTPKSNKKRSGR